MRMTFAAVAMIATLGLNHSASAQTAEEVAKAKDEIWAKEKTIYTYAERNLGRTYYFNNSADSY